MQYKSTGDTSSMHDLARAGVLARYLVIAFVLGFGFQLLALRGGLDGPRAPGAALLLLTMWAPAVAALLAGRAARRALRASLRWPGLRPVAAGAALGALPTVAKTLLLLATGRGAWDAAHFTRAPHGGIAGVHHLGMLLGVGPQSWTGFACNLLLTLLVATALVGVCGGTGEELGWRCLLQPALARRLGVVRGTLTVAAIWAAWHLPVNLAGYNDPVHPVLTSLLLFPAGCVCLSFVLAALRVRSGSVWPAALAHGANNVVAAGLLIAPRSWADDQWSTLAGMVLVGGFCAWRLVRMDAPRARAAWYATSLPAAHRPDSTPVPAGPRHTTA